jgi:recombination protein RecR
MMKIPYRDLDRLVSYFSKVPGIGERGALRISLFLTGTNPKKGRELAKALLNVIDNVGRCVCCNNISFNERCWVCKDEGRDTSVIMVVETVLDLFVMEDVGYRGLYHVVGDFLPSTRRIPEEVKRKSLEMLKKRINSNGVKEVILAFPYTVRGDALTRFFKEALEGRVLLTRLARGVPVGGEVEYLDPTTLGFALNRREKL